MDARAREKGILPTARAEPPRRWWRPLEEALRLLGSRWGAMLALALVATLWLGRQAGTLYESTSKSSLLYGAAGRNDRLVIEWERQRARAPGAPKVLVAQ